jgi:hypothetical protein
MEFLEFKDFPSQSKLWVFTLREELSSQQLQQLEQKLGSFIAAWTAHKMPVRGAVAFPYRCFVLVVADSIETDVSGCSIDSLSRAVESACAEVGVELTDPATIYFKDNQNVTSLHRDDFQQLVSSGKVNSGTPVFNNAVSSLDELRRGRWELPFAESWHAKRFGLSK